ncbi:MAG: DNA replication/repair protein RecF [Coriobacteriaceae bacterium]
MGLKVATLSLYNFRNFTDTEFSFSPSMTILQGSNAVGKTNTVEALQLLTAGQSFRKPTAAQLLHDGAAEGSAKSELVGDGRHVEAALEIQHGRRRFLWNTKPCRGYDLASNLMSVLFNPDDLSFVKRSASYRRDELDGFGSQVNRGYAKLVRAYMRSVEQRNRLLKDTPIDKSLLNCWDASVALGGATLLTHRLALFRRLAQAASEIYSTISASEHLECHYLCSLGDIKEGMGREEYETRFADKLARGRDDAIRRQMTLVGPQRDDIQFTLDGRDARDFGSQGQQRTIVLAWKMAEVKVATEIRGTTPLLLLDDVMSELDEERRRSLTRFMQKDMQTVITTTNLGYFSQDILDGAQVIQLGCEKR